VVCNRNENGAIRRWARLLTRTQAANGDGGVVVWAIETGGLPWMYHYPDHAASLGKRSKVLRCEPVPSAGQLPFPPPLRCHLGKDRGDAAVLHFVGEHAAFRDRAEALIVFAWDQHVIRRKGKDGDLWRII